MKSINIIQLIRQYLPPLFFIVLFVMGAVSSNLSAVNIISAGIALLILGNIFLKNKIINKILGIIFLLCSCYMMLAIWDDYVDGEATRGYLFLLFLILFSIAMSIMLMVSHREKEPVEISGQS